MLILKLDSGPGRTGTGLLPQHDADNPANANPKDLANEYAKINMTAKALIYEDTILKLVQLTNRGHLSYQILQYLADKMRGKGNLAIMLGLLSNNATHNHAKGVKEVLKKDPDIKVLQKQAAESKRDKAISLMSN